MKEIQLLNGRMAIVDDEDYEMLIKHRWSFCKTGYAMRATTMHREIMNGPMGMSVDHINGNGLDNRKENLRICTHSQNRKNQKISTGYTSPYKGVSRLTGSKKWRTVIMVNYKSVHIGVFDDEEDAAYAYNKAALEYFGEFARLNTIPV